MGMIRASQPITDTDIPAPIARDAEIKEAIDGHLRDAHPHGQYLQKNPSGIEFAQAPQNYLDFHTGPQSNDFDGRFIVSGGGISNGLAQLLFQFALITFNSKISINGGTQLSRLLVLKTTVDLPSIASGASVEITRSVVNAAVEDLVFFCPLEMPSGLSFINFQAVATAGGVRIIFRNLSSGALDIIAFSAKILVLGI